MVAPVAAIGAVSATVVTINTIKSWVNSLEGFVRDFKDAGELLWGLRNRIQACESRLDNWLEFWELEGARGGYMRELWGSRGTDNIVSQLTTIQSLCNKFNESLSTFFGDTSLAQQIQRASSRDSLESTSVRLAGFEAYTRTIKLTSSNTQVFNFIRTLRSRMLEWLSDVGTQLEQLENDAIRAYSVRHRQVVQNFLTEDQKKLINSGILMQMTVEYRNSAEELFRECFSMEIQRRRSVALAQGFIKLKVDLMAASNGLELRRPPSAQDIAERYHLLVQRDRQGRGSSEAEVCILRSVVATPQPDISPSVLAAYQAVLENNRPAHALCEGSMFLFRPPLEEERLVRGDRPVKPLTDLLEDPNPDTFLLQDRIHLAYKVVECGAFLTGTSWFAKLKTSHVICSKSSAGFYYTLDIQPPTSATGVLRTTLMTQILFIGAFLIEIGTGMLVKDISSGGDEVLFELEARRTDRTRASPIPSSKTYSKEDVKSILIKNNLGDSYSSAALHCFGQEIREKCQVLSQSQDEAILKSYKEVLKDYFLKIYSP
jgi:hypothetical protein